MKREHRVNSLIITSLVLVLALIIMIALSSAQVNNLQITPGYPGHTDYGAIDLAHHHVLACTSAYYRIHGCWPATWQEVLDDQLCQFPLLSPSGHLVNPDDGSLDFSYDVLLSNVNGEVTIKYLAGTKVDEKKLPIPPTYKDQLEDAAATTGIDRFLAIAEDTDQLKLFALLHMCGPAIYTYKEKYGELPATWQELLNSGLLPFNGISFNPKSGQPMSETTGPWGIVYERVDSDTYKLRHLDENGEPIQFGISY